MHDTPVVCRTSSADNWLGLSGLSVSLNGELRHIRWEELTKRDDEVGGVSKIAQFKADANGYFRQEISTVEGTADTSTDLRLQNALRRRGYACEVAGIMSFKVHETIIEEYFRVMQEDPGAGWKQVTVQQVYARLT